MSVSPTQELVDAWRTNQRINSYLLDRIDASGMTCTLSKRGGRDVARQFAHMHDVRVYQLEKRAKHLATGLAKFQGKGAPKVVPSKTELNKALSASARAVEALLRGIAEGAPKMRGFKKGIFTTLSYLVSHEAHHRGRILLTQIGRAHV